LSKTRITISARRRPKSKENPPDKPVEKKPGGGPELPGDRYTDAQCRVTVADISTLYRYASGTWTSPVPPDEQTFGRAVIGVSKNPTDHGGDTWGVSATDPRDEDSVLESNEALLYFLDRVGA